MRCILLTIFFSTACAFAQSQPNIVFINVDDMSRDSIGAFGSKVENITPNIDKLASEGMAFDKAHVTIAICQPTRAVWMTGRYPHQSGALGFDPIDKDVRSLPEAMGKGGYYNALIGKAIHIIPTRHAAFDYIQDQGELGHGRSAKLYAEAIRKSIKNAKTAGKPFFITASTHDPHRPFDGSPYDYKGLPPVTRKITVDEVTVPGFLPDLPDIRKEMARYYTSVFRADEVVGSILDEIKAAGVEEDTVVIFMSDHGMPLPFAKTNCYLASTATPWIVKWPGNIKAGMRDDKHFISGVDLAPTILDIAGLPNLAGANGKSTLPLLRGEKQAGREMAFTFMNSIYGNKPYPMRAVIEADRLYIWNGWSDGNYKFRNESMSGLTFSAMQAAAKNDEAIAKRTQFFLYRVKEELYDLSQDPDCLKNLIKSEEAETVMRLKNALHAEMEKTSDPLLKKFRQEVF